jgi:hypothetical protein
MSETPDVNQAGEAASFDPPASASVPVEFRYGLNVPLVDKLLDWMKRSQEGALDIKEPTWDQANWFDIPRKLDGTRNLEVNCGTTCCVAGYIAEDAKVIGQVPMEGDLEPTTNLMYNKVNHLGITWENWCNELGWNVNDSYWEQSGIPWELVGAFFLGITTWDARNLFDASNSRSDLEGMLEGFRTKYPA